MACSTTFMWRRSTFAERTSNVLFLWTEGSENRFFRLSPRRAHIQRSTTTLHALPRVECVNVEAATESGMLQLFYCISGKSNGVRVSTSFDLSLSDDLPRSPTMKNESSSPPRPAVLHSRTIYPTFTTLNMAVSKPKTYHGIRVDIPQMQQEDEESKEAS